MGALKPLKGLRPPKWADPRDRLYLEYPRAYSAAIDAQTEVVPKTERVLGQTEVHTPPTLTTARSVHYFAPLSERWPVRAPRALLAPHWPPQWRRSPPLGILRGALCGVNSTLLCV